MTLQKVPVHLNLTGGLQKKDDEFLVIPSKLNVADNVQFDDATTVVPRGGQAQVSLGAFNALAIKRTFSHQGVAVLEQSTQLTRAGAGGLAQVLMPQLVDGFTPPRAGPRAGMITQRIAGIHQKGTAYGAGIPFYDGSYDCASIGNVTCYAFETRNLISGRQTVRVVLVDDANNFRLYDTTMIPASTTVLVKPRVVANASKFFIFVGSFTSGTNTFDIKSMTLTPAGSASALSSAIFTSGAGGTIEGTANDQVLFDVAFSADLSMLGLVIRDLNATVDLNFYSLSTTDGSSVLDSNQVTPSARPISITALFTKGSTDYKLHAFYSISTNVAKAACYNFTTSTSTAETTVGTAAGGTVVGRIAAYEQSTTLIYLAFDSLTSTTAPFTSLLRLSSFTHSYNSLTECATFSPWVIAGRIGVVNSRLYLPMAFLSSEYQGTHFVIDLTSALVNLGVSGSVGTAPHVAARIDYGESALSFDRWKTQARVPSMPVRSNSFILPYLKYETNIRLAGTTDDTAYALARAVIDFDSQLQHEEINGLTFLAGACPYIFDGFNYVEENFHHAPEILGSLTAVAAGGTYTLGSATVTVTVCFTWAWQDAQGNWHESAPSGEKSVNITAALPCISPNIASPPTQKPGAQLLMYRTKGSSTDTSMYLAVKSDGSSISSDTDLDDGEQLYTTGGVLPNTPAPACRHVSTFQKRLVLSGCGDGSQIHWSKVSSPGFGVEFSSGDPTHQQYIAADKGRVVGTEEQDNTLVVLCERACGVIGGTGPNAAGTAGQYSDFSTIVKELGCDWDSPKSIIGSSEGVWFRSPFGVRLVSRAGGLAMSPDGKQAGAEVDALVSGNLVALAGDAKQQVRFYQSSGTALVWDTQWRQWTRFTGMSNVDVVLADGRFYTAYNDVMSGAALLRYTDETTYTDVSDQGVAGPFYAIAETPWLSFGGIQGFQRVYGLLLLGKNVVGAGNNIDLTGTIYVNYSDLSSADGFNTLSLLPSQATTGKVQFEHKFAVQKCQSMKIRITWAPASGTAGRMRLTDLTLLVGVKSGFYKVPSSTRY